MAFPIALLPKAEALAMVGQQNENGDTENFRIWNYIFGFTNEKLMSKICYFGETLSLPLKMIVISIIVPLFFRSL